MKKNVFHSILFSGLCLAMSAFGGESPFAIQPAVINQEGNSLHFKISITVPANHLIYEREFALQAEKGQKIEWGARPKSVQKPDPFIPEETVGVYTNSFVVEGKIISLKKGPIFSVSLQGCDPTQCYMPETHQFCWDGTKLFLSDAVAESPGEKAVAATEDWLGGREKVIAGGYLNATDFLAFLDQAEGKQSGEKQSSMKRFFEDPKGFLEEHGMGLMLLLVLLGGLLLNFTPCVLPMIPINLAIIGAGSASGGKKRGFLLGGTYGAGMAFSYGLVGLIILRTGLFMGALQSSPYFSLAIALLFLFFSLASFGIFNVDLTRFTHHGQKENKKGFVTAFVAGMISALLAGSCVAPVVLAVLVLAGALSAEGQVWAQFLPFALGIGMALPWPFAGAGLAVLPRPGAWMARVRVFFGCVLLLLAAYYGYVCVQGFRSASGSQTNAEGSIRAGDREAWQAKFKEAEQKGLPIFVDCWATWCKNCSAMERSTFREERVKARLSKYLVIKVQAENPSEPKAKAQLEALGAQGLPAFAVLRAPQK